MRVLNLKSQESPELNAKILRSIEDLVCYYREVLPEGWRYCIEFQNSDDIEPYFALDVQSNQGGGDFAPVQMEMLRLYSKFYPSICGTGRIHPIIIRTMLNCIGLKTTETEKLLASLADKEHVSEVTEVEWERLKNFGITHRYGGIRIPYDVLATYVDEPLLASEKAKQHVEEAKGEIRITFDGAKDWQNVYLCFCLFERIQSILNSLWGHKQIWYNLRGFQDDPCLQFWVKARNIAEAPED